MKDVTVIECRECQNYREADGYSWCAFWSNDTDEELVEALVEPDGYCSYALLDPKAVQERN